MPASPTQRVEQPDRDAIAQQLERILVHPLLKNSRRLGDFLRFSVEAALAGKSEELKEYVIGVQVFGKGEEYSPNEDPIVRIMAGRLRAKLAEYYSESGAEDAVLIDLPRGGYAPRFSVSGRRRTAKAAPRGPRKVAVGRERELAQLREAVAAVASGAGMVVNISGEAGMGKTTVAEEFLAELAGTGEAYTARGRCSERLAESDAFAPILEALDGLCHGADGAGPRELMETAAPAWFRQVAPGGGDGKEVSHEKLRRQFVSYMEALSSKRPVVLFLDDMHWADSSTCDLLAYVGGRLSGLAVLVIATYRPGKLQEAPSPYLPVMLDMERKGKSREMRLRFLSKQELETYLAATFPGHGFGADFAAAVHERTEGNPLFITDLMRYLGEKGYLAQRGGRWEQAKSTAEIREVIPEGTQGMIELKIRQLQEEDEAILLCGAVQGIRFDTAIVAQVLGMDAAVVEERLRELERIHRFVDQVEEKDVAGQPLSVRYRFVHVFYQNALYASLPPSKRAADSLAVASALAAIPGDGGRPAEAELAVLYEQGRDFARAARMFLNAARNAARVFGYPEAILLCERGLRALARVGDSKERDEQELLFSLMLGMALMSTRGYAAPEVEKTYRRSRELCLRLNESRRLIPVLWGIHTCETNGGRLVEALDTAVELRRTADALGHKDTIVESLHAYGTTLAFMGRLVEAREALERIVEIAPAGEHEFRGSMYVLDPIVTSLSMLARLLTMMGEYAMGRKRAEESFDLANRLAHPHSVAYATFWLGWVVAAMGETEKGREQLEASLTMSENQGLPLIAEWARVVSGSVVAELGQSAEGIQRMRKSLERQWKMGSQLERPYCLTLLAEALLRDGEYIEALETCDEALLISLRSEGRCYEAETHRVRGEAVWGLYGDLGKIEAEGELRRAVEMARAAECRHLELRAALSLFRLLKKCGEGEKARSVLRETVARFGEEGPTPALAEARRLVGLRG